ncbi:hypothetical protein ACFE04_021675 [Oxalis oulophora]
MTSSLLLSSSISLLQYNNQTADCLPVMPTSSHSSVATEIVVMVDIIINNVIFMWQRYRLFGGTILGTEDGIRCPNPDPFADAPRLSEKREGGWMEIEMGEFFDDSGDDGT